MNLNFEDSFLFPVLCMIPLPTHIIHSLRAIICGIMIRINRFSCLVIPAKICDSTLHNRITEWKGVVHPLVISTIIIIVWNISDKNNNNNMRRRVFVSQRNYKCLCESLEFLIRSHLSHQSCYQIRFTWITCCCIGYFAANHRRVGFTETSNRS